MRRYIGLMLLIAVVMVSCKKKDDSVPVERGRTFLHIVGGAEVDPYNLTFDYWNADDVVIKEFYYKRNFPFTGYADMEEGGTPDQYGNGKMYISLSRQPFVDVAADTIMQPMDIVLNPDEKSTICVADSFGKLVITKLQDVYAEPTDSTINVRLINLSSGLVSSALTSSDNSINISGVAFLSASDFVTVPAGNYILELKDDVGAVIGTSSLYLGGKATYSFYNSGISTNLDYFKH